MFLNQIGKDTYNVYVRDNGMVFYIGTFSLSHLPEYLQGFRQEP